MEPDTLNDKADAAQQTGQEPAPDQPAETVSIAAEAPSSGSVPVPDEAVAVPEADASDDTLPTETAADEPVAASDEEEEQPLAVAEGEAVEAVEATVPFVAAAVDRSAEILDTLVQYQNDWSAEQAAAREKSELALQELAGLAGKVALLSTTTAAMTVTLQKMADETEQLAHWSEEVKGAGVLSKLFQIVAILVLVLLLGGMSFLAVRQYQAQHHLHVAEAGIAAAIKTQQKQIAEYDKHFADLVGGELKKEREASSKASVQEKINRVRNGLAEQQLHRKNNGDWFVVTGKNEAAITDPDIIEELNQAFIRAGRALTTPYLVPPHKVVVALRPNGKGGTEIVVTKEVAP